MMEKKEILISKNTLKELRELPSHEKVAELVEYGFSEDVAWYAMQKEDHDFREAVEWLCDHNGIVKDKFFSGENGKEGIEYILTITNDEEDEEEDEIVIENLFPLKNLQNDEADKIMKSAKKMASILRTPNILNDEDISEDEEE